MGNLFSKFFGTVGVIDSIRVTLVMSFWSTLIASMLGIFLGLVLEQTKFPGKKLVVRVNRTLMGAPPVVIGLLTYMLLRKKGPFGALRWVFTIKGMVAAQVLMTKDTMTNDASRCNARNTFDELLKLGAVPVVNENDTVSTSEIPYVDNFGDNDRLSAIVSALIGADLLILLSDIDGLFTDDPRKNPEAKMIPFVPEITKELLSMGKETSGSGVGTGGMAAKLAAAQIATDSGSDMVIANADQVDVIYQITAGEDVGTLFLAHKNKDFDLIHYLNHDYEKKE